MAGEHLREVVDRLRQALGPDPAREVADAELLRRWRERKDQAAFELLVWRHAPMMLGVCRRLLGDEHEAEDAVQAAFLVLAKKARSIRRREALAAWLYRVAYRAALECRARRKRWPAANERAVRAAAGPPADEPLRDDLRSLLDEEVERLPAKFRVPFVLCHLEGRSNQEAARTLGCPLGTIVSRLSRARERLRGRLSRRGVMIPAQALATVVTASAAQANLPPMLIQAIVQSSGLFLAGGSAAGAISPQVAGLAKGVLYTMLMTKLRSAALVLMVLVAGAGAGTGLAFHLDADEQPDAAVQPQPDQPRPGRAAAKPGTGQDLIVAFDRLAPAARLQALDKHANADKEIQPAVRGDIAATLIERGSLEAAETSAIVSPLKSTIKWIIDEGSVVQKGDKLVQLDNAALGEKFNVQKIVVQKAHGERQRAGDDFQAARKNNSLDIRFGEIDIRLAELEVKKYRGNDALEKEALELKLERVRLQLERTKLAGEARERKALAELRTKEALARQAEQGMGEIERQAQMCVLYAPQDGLVIYDLPPLRIDQGVVLESHVGESVKEGQKLAHVADLKRLNVHSRIHESVITQVRAGQQATVRVDAFPNQVLPATVKQVATVASPQAWLRANVKVYDVQLAILGEMPALKPGMTAEVRIAVGGKKGVVQVPVQAVLGSGGESFCYVKAGQEIQKRKVVPGVRSEQAVEIKAGVKEGEEVLRDPRGLLERLRPVLIPPAESKRNKQTSRIRAIQIRNGAPGMAKGGSCWGNRRRDVIIPDTKDSAIAPQINLRC